MTISTQTLAERLHVQPILDKLARVRELSRFTHVYHKVDFAASDEYAQLPPERFEKASIDEANIISSKIDVPWGGSHSVMLDIDHRCALVPSSTPGHFHLYIDVEMGWSQYQDLLEVMARVGILEPGYVEASKARKATHLRLPWVKKERDVPPVREDDVPPAGSKLPVPGTRTIDTDINEGVLPF